jgi:hypothetical protein
VSAVIEVSNVSGVGVILEVSATQPGFVVGVEATAIDVPLAPEFDGGNVTGGNTEIEINPRPDEEYVTRYEWLVDGVSVNPIFFGQTSFTFSGDLSGKVILFRAVNAAGPGPYSDPITIS